MKLRPTRSAATAAVVVAGVLALTACGGGAADDAATAGSGSSSSTAKHFTYRDARHKEVELSSTPRTVVAQSSVAAALWDDGYHVAGAYGELTPGANGKLNYQAGSLDLKKVKVIGSTYGEFDLDKYATLQPDLLVDYSYDQKTLWYVPSAQASQVLAIAPSIGLPGEYPSTDAAVKTLADLAAKLGANTSSKTLTAEKEAYASAEAKAKEAAGTSGLKVVVVSPSKDSLYVANPSQVPELATLQKAGLSFIKPSNEDDSQVYTTQSWEQASQYQDADAIFVDARSYAATLAAVKDVPAWQALPAVKAGHVYPWYAAAPYSYKSYAKIYTDFAADLAKAKG